MHNRDVVIEELNTILRGTYMGIRSFEHYIQHVQDSHLKETFQTMQQELKHHAQQLCERIQNLHGVPADSEGVTGKMHSFMHSRMLSHETDDILEDALKGLDKYGIHYSEEIVRGDVDPESRRIVEEVIDTNRKFVDDIRAMLH
ncbi:DUF2383 domain-containing protein [Alteribacillus persepolensis]|uniref:DUF2383 domain-containing protein n=1 Tax=Alteribacillus persepolensis TaxID=568899 RepID=UPI000B845387|nr:DUF2383 domain-containing protein [Alteribacillus persepolensis]